MNQNFLQPEDLLKFGLIPEFIGRIPIYAVLDQLNEKTLKMILTEPKDAILKQYQALLKMDGVDLEFEPEAIDLIAKEAIKRKTGARALRSIKCGSLTASDKKRRKRNCVK